ncbi:hypothetical protein B0H15DRAFT_434201 [Mycena belliarum]|uniref:Uncharacterized protein n=1 Tax=Mycena belliarum TaxID=1033014 RepID=A0AAD6XLH4_9AGAR|nr:hypothetical protein B0H15DRAFT_434201 [Mycena belliae]
MHPHGCGDSMPLGRCCSGSGRRARAAIVTIQQVSASVARSERHDRPRPKASRRRGSLPEYFGVDHNIIRGPVSLPGQRREGFCGFWMARSWRRRRYGCRPPWGLLPMESKQRSAFAELHDLEGWSGVIDAESDLGGFGSAARCHRQASWTEQVVVEAVQVVEASASVALRGARTRVETPARFAELRPPFLGPRGGQIEPRGLCKAFAWWGKRRKEDMEVT